MFYSLTNDGCMMTKLAWIIALINDFINYVCGAMISQTWKQLVGQSTAIRQSVTCNISARPPLATMRFIMCLFLTSLWHEHNFHNRERY